MVTSSFLQWGGARCRPMLNHLRGAVGALHSQKSLNFGVSWGEEADSNIEVKIS